ncbi:NADH dehydrogenase [ubiquinone] 1 beta subcomplex subunit 5, mitochondrial-like [Saccostrea echinata]|uniref:NADH dehydrogenase [ubiquinone] 1 beta subcomplex subunit 5, mitochondrial-like n=1 Tax=Saccostrea echinata TaxID=191078 RepID=UPI002A7F5240|nr:NADH dehydrogenase [ubiquinone] 1 beta subcomplex subunit 5, mitochondrial-like [Saccostrea echinata]
MILFSCLRMSTGQGTRQFFSLAIRTPQTNSEILKSKSALQELVRSAHYGDGFIGVPRFGTRIKEYYVKNDLIKYFWIALTPVAALSLVNTYIGPAELKDIPEGYEPRHWEYYRTPVQRFMHKWVYSSYEQAYEKNLHTIDLKYRRRIAKSKYKMVDEHMRHNTDYKGWYYSDDRRIEGVKIHDQMYREKGIFREFYYGRPPYNRTTRLRD